MSWNYDNFCCWETKSDKEIKEVLCRCKNELLTVESKTHGTVVIG